MPPSYSDLASNWSLNPDIVYLNHGSFGATPRSVQGFRAELQASMENDPMRFFVHDVWTLIDDSRMAVSNFVGADPEGLVFGENATALVNGVLRSLQLDDGDEILVLDHGYGACTNAARYVCEKVGANLVVVDVPFPLDDPSEVTDAILATITERTVLAVIDHVTSPTALVLPIAEIVSKLAERGIDVLVDGAHAPGMLDLDINAIDAAYYVGNLHKWVCGPKSAAFMSVRSDHRQSARPLVISHGATGSDTTRSRLHLEFDWQGTSDPTAIAAIGETIKVMDAMVPGGWPQIRQMNRDLARAASKVLCSRLGTISPAPASMFGSMGLIPIPGGLTERIEWPGLQPLQQVLDDTYQIPIPIVPWPKFDTRFVRISAHLYNTMEQYEYLADALVSEVQ